MNAQGQLTEIVDGQGFMVFVPFSDTYLIEKREMTQFEVRMDDGRTISAQQRNKIFALISDVTDYISMPPEPKRKRAEAETLREMQLLYLIDKSDKEAVRRQLTTHYCDLVNVERFSLSDIDMTTGREFIDWLVELCVVHGIPCNDTLLNRAEDISRYLYACLIHKSCCICGNKKTECHHEDSVGSGRNRKEIIHIGMKVMSLCAIHHIECHSIGQSTFNEKYKVFGIKADETICKARGLRHEV